MTFSISTARTRARFVLPLVAATGLLVAASTQAVPLVTALASTTVADISDPGAPFDFADGPANGNVDVLDFRNDGLGNDSGIHTFGNSSGTFGSRSSGSGFDFTVLGTFLFEDTLTNNSADDQAFSLDFSLIPGEVHVGLFDGSELPGDILQASFVYDILVNGVSVFSTTYEITNTATGGLTQTQTGTDIGGTLSADGSLYSYGTFNGVADLGTFGAGESFDVSFQLDTLALGDLDPANGCLFGDDGGERELDVEGDVFALFNVGETAGCGAIARFGDPVQGAGGNTFSITAAPVGVPVPATLAVLLAGLITLVGARRR